MRLQGFFRRALTQRRLHLCGLDPCNYTVAQLGELVVTAARSGTDGFLLGGSDGVNRRMIDDLSGNIRAALEAHFDQDSRPPLILFPSSAQTGVARDADGVLYLSLLNSRNPRFLIREQAAAAPEVRALGLPAIGCALIVVAPGRTVGRVGEADLIDPMDSGTAVGYALAAEYFGFPLVYLNAGSGSPTPVPAEMICAVAAAVSIPLIVGGGLTDEGRVAAAIEAGADIVITGTAIEDAADVGETVARLAAVVHARSPRCPA